MLQETSIDMREGTTRNISIACKDKTTGEAFDFTGYTVQTHLSIGDNREYVDTTITDNVVSYKIPASISVGARSGIAETRIFNDGDVYEVIRINITVCKADQPDIEPADTSE